MLTCSIDLRAQAQPWQWCEQGKSWVRGEDRIRPLAHAALEARAVTDGSTTLMVVRERVAGRPSLLRSTTPVRVDSAVYARALQECHDWPLQGICVEADTGGVRLCTGLGGVCPLYLTHRRASDRLMAADGPARPPRPPGT
ncbi:hypothetical protein [Streptomyces sp. ISL-100]|uniref:hypothetical protein n=1 Tax=Streptomyces sp. ISL-100 TaxID=2819173 RepID=UPI001BECF6E2|nr:hypothetical protein [Streptomyces sp. ISL-100]MBT2401217.1 hypothetical protein [Streptomyces sp. ISL-100]